MQFLKGLTIRLLQNTYWVYVKIIGEKDDFIKYFYSVSVFALFVMFYLFGLIGHLGYTSFFFSIASYFSVTIIFGLSFLIFFSKKIKIEPIIQLRPEGFDFLDMLTLVYAVSSFIIFTTGILYCRDIVIS